MLWIHLISVLWTLIPQTIIVVVVTSKCRKKYVGIFGIVEKATPVVSIISYRKINSCAYQIKENRLHLHYTSLLLHSCCIFLRFILVNSNLGLVYICPKMLFTWVSACMPKMRLVCVTDTYFAYIDMNSKFFIWTKRQQRGGSLVFVDLQTHENGKIKMKMNSVFVWMWMVLCRVDYRLESNRTSKNGIIRRYFCWLWQSLNQFFTCDIATFTDGMTDISKKVS